MVFLNYISESIKRNESKVSVSLSENAPNHVLGEEDSRKKKDKGCCWFIHNNNYFTSFIMFLGLIGEKGSLKSTFLLYDAYFKLELK